MKSKKVNADELLNQIKKLQNELFTTDIQFELFVGLRKAAPNYKDVFQSSPLFWDYTMQTHITMVVLRLCRLYDTDDKVLSLPIFLRAIESNCELFTKEAFAERNKDSPNLERMLKYPRGLDLKKLREAQNDCSSNNPIVKNLLVTRHHFIAHTNYDLAFDGAEIFQKKYFLPFRDIKKLIEHGLNIVNTYAAVFGASYFPGVESTNYPVHDYKFILDCVKKQLEL